MSSSDHSARHLVAPGEIRPDLFKILGAPRTELDILLGIPGLLEPYPGWAQLVRAPGGALPRRAAYAHRAAVLEQLSYGIDHLPQTSEWEELLRSWATAIESTAVRVRHFIDHPLHSRLVSLADRSVVPQAPLSTSTFALDHELSVELHGEQHQRARQWFQRHFDRAHDINDEVLRGLRESWAGDLCSARDIYHFVLTRYFRDFVEGIDLDGDDNPMLEHLTEFQKEAYVYAKTILQRYGGVFLADVVGLGKTFIALALLEHLQRRYGEHAVVIAPPSVCPAWLDLAAEFRVELVTVSLGKLEDLERFSDREIVVIDESHNFRNTGTLRYDTINHWLRPDGAASNRKVLLLSATPQNNSPEDVKNQLALFPNNYPRLPYRGEDPDAWFRDVAAGRASLRDLLQHIVVRRTRRYISRAHPDARLRVRLRPGHYEDRPLRFPARVSGEDQCLRYALDTTYGRQFYAELLQAIRTMRYPLHGVGRYVRQQAEDDRRVVGLRRAGTSVRGLFKVLLLKRLESSVHALRQTLHRLHTRLSTAIPALAEGRVPIPAHARSSDDIEEHEGAEATSPGYLPAELFDIGRLREDVEADHRVVAGLVAQVDGLVSRRDEKLERLLVYLFRRPPQEHRTLVFTQFSDTATYLADQLGKRFGRTELTTGSTPGVLRTARRFAPKANRVEIAPEEQIDLLITTDVLSEGVNLQDADTLINYDLHWNPLRLIQRAGRIDRLGSEHEEIHIASFLPQRELESDLQLEAVLRRRIKDFIEVFGEDSNVLPGSERLDAEQVEAAYTGRALDEADANDDLDGLSRHIAQLVALRKDEPERFARILELRPGRRAISSIGPSIVATRCDWYWEFWTPAEQEDTRLDRLDAQRALDALERHAEMVEPPPPEAARGSLELVERARASFLPLVAQFRQQRTQPRLSAPEMFVLGRLERYRSQCPAPRLPLLDRLEAWVRSGQGQVALRKYAKQWKREKLASPAVFEEVRVLMARFPPQEEELGEAEVVGSVVGPLREERGMGPHTT